MPMTARICTLAVTLPALLLGGCSYQSGLWGNDEFERYAQRLDTVTDSAGNAKEVNRVLQTPHPWPRYVFDPRIPVSSSRMSNAVRTYRSGPAPLTPQGAEGDTWTAPAQTQPSRANSVGQ
jgi:hypothetical protein